jgi:hypothetical protein
MANGITGVAQVPAVTVPNLLAGDLAIEGGLAIDFKHQYVYIQGRGVLSTSSPDSLHGYSILHLGK